MEKIVITGALGYIGVELCKLYFSETGDKNIVAIDNRFTSERVKILRDNEINFINGDVLDESLMKDILKDSDKVYHLAGITDVAYTKFESNEGKDLEIRKNGIQGTLNIINSVPKHCKLIFPSTHVVYEGVEDIFNIEEDYPTKTLLTYATQKRMSEIDIKNSNIDNIIVRLGSVYGYSNDTTRMNIMPQLFSKIASQCGKITLTGGSNFKSMVSLLDVARAMKFLAESDLKNETYHLISESMTIRDVANICKKYSPKVTIEEALDKAYSPNYTLSNKKLLSTGFKFQHDVDSSIKDMIYNWTSIENRKYIDGL